MNRIIVTFLAILLFGFCSGQEKNSRKEYPNIVFILADDLGYGDVGVFFQNERANEPGLPVIKTPHLDKLAAEGAMLTNHYCGAPVCAPSRASLFLGKNQGQANVRNNQFDKEIEENHTLGTILQQNGYNTALVGKWGLQGREEGPNWPAHPFNRGFDYYMGYIRHADGHEHYPKEGLYRGRKEVYEGKKVITESLDKAYTGDLFTAASKKWIMDQNKQNPENPFFLFLSFDTPHAVLELPTQEYPEGGGLNGGLSWLGEKGRMINTAYGEPDSYVDPRYANAIYDHDYNPQTAEKPWPDTYKRYATVVSRIDHQVGDLVQLLKDLEIFQNTMIVFTSDNGPSRESYLPDGYVENNPEFFQSFGPFEGIKRDVWEGGMREPTIVSWPKKIRANIVIDKPSGFYDWLATFCEAIDQPKPVGTNGNSILPDLMGKQSDTPRIFYTEYYQKWDTPDYQSFSEDKRGKSRGEMQMLRIGDTLGIRYDITSAGTDFQFFDIPKDPAQRNPLKLENDENYQQKWKELIVKRRFENKTAPRPYDQVAIPSLAKPTSHRLSWEFFEGDFPWVSDVSRLGATLKGESSGLNKLQTFRSGILKITDTIYVPESGRYDFKLKAAAPTVLKIYEIALIDADFNHSVTKEYKNSIVLEKGYHPIILFYHNKHRGKPDIDLVWNL